MGVRRWVLSESDEDVATDALVAELMARIARLDIHLADYQEEVKDALKLE